MKTIQGEAYLNGEKITILDIAQDTVLAIVSQNPVETDWIKLDKLDNVIWYID